MAGTIVADDIQHSTAGSVGTEYVVEGTAKVWTVIKQTGTQEIKDSFGQSSLTDTGTGIRRINFSNSFATQDGQSVTSFNSYEVKGGWYNIGTTSYTDIVQYDTEYRDVDSISVHIFGDLA